MIEILSKRSVYPYNSAMEELQKEAERKTRCVLVGEPGNDLRELKSLIDTLGMETVSAITLSRLEVQPAYGMGKGKAEEIASGAKECEADCIVSSLPTTLIMSGVAITTSKSNQPSPCIF